MDYFTCDYDGRMAHREDDPHRPLRDDVRRLGTLLGDTLRQQAGVEALAECNLLYMPPLQPEELGRFDLVW